MALWQYTAVPLMALRDDCAVATAVGPTHGELPGDSAADVRASLRRAGLQVIRLKPLGRATRSDPSRFRRVALPGRGALAAHLRGRRGSAKAELYDSLATLQESGLPLMEAVDTVAGSASTRGRLTGSGGRRAMLLEVREAVRGGSSLGDALERHPTWFDGAEVAMVQAGQHSGQLGCVLRSLAQRQERSSALTQRLIGALAYPTVVACVGVGVVVFLSTKTLPQLVGILENAKVPAPRLTLAMMTIGRTLATRWPLLALAIPTVMIGMLALRTAADRRGLAAPSWLRELTPSVLRRLAVSRLWLGLAELLKSGVPLVDAMRVLAPTVAGPATGSLRRAVLGAADRLERGADLADTLDDPLWFDPESRRLVEVGQAAGELERVLERLGEREGRRCQRAIDRLAAVLEPGVILVLAVLVGTVVMAAVLPLIRLQEVLK
jgi:type II secretory pathway component PulF